LSWTVSNTGAGRASADWYDYVYLSDDAKYDNNDIYLSYSAITEQTPLVAGANYTINQTVNIPRAATSGNKYVLFVADRYNSQGEVDETDNVLAKPIRIKNPSELEFTSVNAPTSASLNQTFNLSWTITNTGEGKAFADVYSWYDYVYLSDDTTFDNKDLHLNTRYVSNPLESGNSYTFNADVSLPDTKTGKHYLLFIADSNNNIKEGNELNNVYAAPLEIKTANLKLDEATAPNYATVNQAIPVFWKVFNPGEGDAFSRNNIGSWQDKIYLSKDETIDQQDILLSNWQRNNLVKDSYYVVGKNITIPNNVSGEYYLLFATDADRTLVETDETDNIRAIPLTISENGTNLKVTAATAPATAILGQQVAVNWNTTNTGGLATNSLDWVDRVYLSDNSTFESTDTLLTEQARGSQTPLAAGASYNLAKNIDIPLKGAGSRYLLFVADGRNTQVETNETDNVYALPIELKAPNLTLTAPVSPATAYLGESIELGWTVGNRGEVAALGNWSDTVYISDDRYLGEKDVYLTSRHRSSALAAGSEYSITQNITIPRTEIGDRYLLFLADSSNTQGESNENDNVIAVPFKLTAKDVDLVVSNISAPLESFAGQEVEIAWTVTNNGSDDAKGSWTDQIYLASDPENPTTYKSYGSFNFTGTVAAGKSLERRQKITLPQTLQGKFSVVVKTDTADSLIEYGHEDNNSTIKEELFTSILPTFPNLQVTNVTAPTTAFSSQKTLVEWTVANTGNGATSAPIWYDTVWLSLTLLAKLTKEEYSRMYFANKSHQLFLFLLIVKTNIQ
jgi:subtilase family serine protease